MNEANNTKTPSIDSEETLMNKAMKYTRLVGDAIAIGAIVAVVAYGVVKVIQGGCGCSVDIG